MKIIGKILHNPYFQWGVMAIIAGLFLWWGIHAIIAEDKVLNGK